MDVYVNAMTVKRITTLKLTNTKLIDINNIDVGIECRVDDNKHDEHDDESVVDDGNDHHSIVNVH